MPEQLILTGFDANPDLFKPDGISSRGNKPQGYTLFLAVFPQSTDAAHIAQAAAALRQQHGLAGACLLPERLHVTLHVLARFNELIPCMVVDAARAAAARVVCPSLPVAFDHVLSFASSQAFVLRCDAGSDARIARLRQMLALELRRVGLRHRASATPHMTMLYDPQLVDEHPIEPIRWIATRFALILSHVGVTHHQWIGEWPLADRP